MSLMAQMRGEMRKDAAPKPYDSCLHVPRAAQPSTGSCVLKPVAAHAGARRRGGRRTSGLLRAAAAPKVGSRRIGAQNGAPQALESKENKAFSIR